MRTDRLSRAFPSAFSGVCRNWPFFCLSVSLGALLGDFRLAATYPVEKVILRVGLLYLSRTGGGVVNHKVLAQIDN